MHRFLVHFYYHSPPLPEQQAIASILGSLDDLIEENRRMNETLEAMARAIFKDWFVDFGPVRAKMEGRTPYLAPEIWDLFPDRLDDEEKPVGWEFYALKQLTSYLSRGLSPKYVENDGVLVLNQKCIRNNAVDFTKARRHDHTLKCINGRELLIGDILVNSTGVGTLGRVAQILHLPEPTTADSHITVVRASSPVTPNFLGLALLGRQDQIEALGEGSTGQTELSRIQLGNLLILLPSTETILQFDLITKPLRSQFSLNLLGNELLASVRDFLLPKLISGEIRVRDAEQLITEAV